MKNKAKYKLLQKKNSFTLTLLGFLLGVLSCSNFLPGDAPTALDDSSAVYRLTFNPSKMQKSIIELIENARESIYVSMYGFHNSDIEHAIIEVWQQRGTAKSLAYAKAHNKVKITLITDYDSEMEETYANFTKAGIPVHLSTDSGIMHNKYFVFDETYVITGSTNLTSGMWRHFNNMIIFRSRELATDYLRDFHTIINGVSATKKDEVFDSIYNSGAGTDNIIGTSDDIAQGKYFGDKIICDSTLAGLSVTLCNEILAGTKQWKDISLTDAQWNNTTNIGFRRALYTIDEYSVYQGKWPEKPRKIGATTVSAFFTPYRKTFPSYLFEEGTAGGKNYYYMNHDKGLIQDVNYETAMNVILSLLDSAKKSVTVFSFAFTDRVVFDKIMKAKTQRGVAVKVYMDYNMFRSTYNSASLTYTKVAEVIKDFKITRQSNGGLLHHKVMFIDDNILITGSLNFSSNATNNNDENFIVVRNASALIEGYKKEAFNINKESRFLLDLESFSGAYDVNANEIAPFL